MMNRVLFTLLLFVAVAPVKATDINGSLPFSPLGVSQNGTDLSNSTIITSAAIITSSVGSGDFAGIGVGTSFGSNIDLDLNSLSTFTISNANWGTFVANGVGNQILEQSANFLSVYLRGTFTGAGTLAGFSPTDTSLRVSVNQSGQSLSAAMTMSSPAVPVPEPSQIALAGIAVSVIGSLGYRRRCN